ncbi:MAG TPA: winged helix-turn-helix domain-containing protein [Kofleriaceae bacterium]|nr:winged helix-turn-helix domain-containing protein [Kofleriaceae bacterium]
MPSDLYVFGPFQLDPDSRRLLREGEPVAISARQFDLLHVLVARAGQVLSKDLLIQAAWGDVAVTDNSLEQAISAIRRLLAYAQSPTFIETLARRGYRFSAPVSRADRREPVETIDALLAPHRAWIEGRAALETLERTHITSARDVFARVLADVPDQAPAHVGLANACVMQFEMTRAERVPDTAALETAARHASEACRLDPRYGEAWATLGFVLDRAGRRADALAASRRAVSLEPDNWRHHVRLGYVSWGEERLREATRALALLPGFPLAHWLAATVHVARQALDDAAQQLAAGIAAEAQDPAHARFSSVALHWLDGLLRLAGGDDAAALDAFDRELAAEQTGHLYARECCANTWYAIAAVRLRRDDPGGAAAALQETLARVPGHVPALAVLQSLGIDDPASDHTPPADPIVRAGEIALGQAIGAARGGNAAKAAAIIEQMLDLAPAGSALWWLPVEPILGIQGSLRPWAGVLARLRNRAA